MTNLQISNRNPLEYLQDYVGPRFDEVRRTHLLPDMLVELAGADEMADDSLDRFIDARLDLVLARLRESLVGLPFDVIDTRSADATEENQDLTLDVAP
jgi:hypothetical protein